MAHIEVVRIGLGQPDNVMTDFPPPSEIMRRNRPYLFSDSTTEGAYVLSRSELFGKLLILELGFVSHTLTTGHLRKV